MGEIDQKAFKNVRRLKLGKSKVDEEAAMLALEWQNEIQNPAWCPFKPGPDGKVIYVGTSPYLLYIYFFSFFVAFTPLARIVGYLKIVSYNRTS